MTGLGFLPGGNYSQAQGVSADGLVVVGYSSDSGGTQAFRWVGGTMTGLGFLPGGNNYSFAQGVSADGSVVVGYGSGSGGTQEAFRWVGGTMTGLGLLPGGNYSQAQGVSADGSVVVGYGFGSVSGAFRWSGGMMIGLPGGSFGAANAANGDGSVVVGYGSGLSGAGNTGFRWINGTPIRLRYLPSGGYSIAYGVSGDGTVVVGRASDAIDNQAFHWTRASGMRSIKELLSAAGVNTDGWHLYHANAVSSDGKTIVGSGIDPYGKYQAWMARLPLPPPSKIAAPHSFNGDGFSDIAWRDTSGTTAAWLMSGTKILQTGSFAVVPT